MKADSKRRQLLRQPTESDLDYVSAIDAHDRPGDHTQDRSRFGIKPMSSPTETKQRSKRKGTGSQDRSGDKASELRFNRRMTEDSGYDQDVETQTGSEQQGAPRNDQEPGARQRSTERMGMHEEEEWIDDAFLDDQETCCVPSFTYWRRDTFACGSV